MPVGHDYYRWVNLLPRAYKQKLLKQRVQAMLLGAVLGVLCHALWQGVNQPEPMLLSQASDSVPVASVEKNQKLTQANGQVTYQVTLKRPA